MEVNTKNVLKIEKKVRINNADLPKISPKCLDPYNFNLDKLDVTLPQEMYLHKFNFNPEEGTSTSNKQVESEFSEPSELSDSSENDNNPAQFIKKLESFYKDMKARLKLLKNTPIIKSKTPLSSRSSKEPVNPNETKKTFQNFKNIPAVKEKLKYIEELDDEIGSIINEYKTEREQRLQIQLELCNDICKNNIYVGKDTQSFLDLCNFEMSNEVDISDDILNDIDVEKKDFPAERETPQKFNNDQSETFIKRNIEVAKTGTLAGSSLTDEEKNRIEVLLQKDDSTVNVKNSENSVEAYEHADSLSSNTLNAYRFLESETVKLVDIEEKLEKFAEDEKNNEKHPNCNIDDEFLLKQALKKINDQLKELQSKEDKLNQCSTSLCESAINSVDMSDIFTNDIHNNEYKNEEFEKEDYGIDFNDGNESEVDKSFNEKDE